jgi:hypothetical protein
MSIRTTLTSAIAFTILWTILIAGIVWFVVRPLAERAVLDDQAASMHRVAAYAVSLVEASLADRTALSDEAARHLALRPSEGESVLRAILERRPDALSARVHSPQVPDQLLIQSLRRSSATSDPPEAEWIPYGGSDSTAIAFAAASTPDSMTLVSRTRFRLHGNDFVLTMAWNATDLVRILSRLPAGDGALVSINAGTEIRWKNWRADAVSLIERERIREPFRDARLELDVAAPTAAAVGRVRGSMGIIILLLAAVSLLPAWRRFQHPH